MTWEQHRYAVERARDRMKKLHDAAIEDREGISLQSEAANSDMELLDDVVDFLKSLEGAKAGDPIGQQFVDDWNRTIVTLSNFCGLYDLPKPDMIFHHRWQDRMSAVAGIRIGSPLIYAGVRVRFGRFESMDVLRS